MTRCSSIIQWPLDCLYTRWRRYQRSYCRLLFAVRTWQFQTHRQYCSRQRSTSARMSMNSFWTCCWKLSVEHVGFLSSQIFSFSCFLFSLILYLSALVCLQTQNKYRQVFSNFLLILCISEPEEVIEFLEEVIAGLFSDQEVRTFEEVIVPMFDIFQGRVKDLDLCQPLLYSYLDVLLYFSHNKDIAKVRKHTETFYLIMWS